MGDKNLAKIPEENDKKSLVEPSQVGEREESLKSFEKVQSDFLKNIFHEFRSIEKQPRSIETDRDFNKTNLKKVRSIENQFRSIENQF